MKTKKGHNYHPNPAPAFSMMIANGGKGAKRRKKKRNPAKAKRASAGIFVVRKPTARSRKKRRNPVAITPRKVGASNWHHARGLYRYNAHKKKRKNPLRCEHVIVKENPIKKRKKRKAGSPIFSSRNNIMSKKSRRRGKRRSRNPVSRRGKRRSGVRRRNPSRRSRGRRASMRNPLPVVRELFGPDMLSFAAGVVVANVGTTMIMNKLLTGTNGVRSFDLPGVDFTAPPATFYSKNAWVLALYKTAIGGLGGYLLRNQSPRLAKGIMVGAVATGISDVLRNTGVLNASGTLGMGRGAGMFLPRGASTYIPGVPPILSGPATAFINNGAPVASRRNGMGAVVNRRWAQDTRDTALNPFRPT